MPTEIQLAHDYLWRVHNNAPARGLLGVWNRSHYEDVVAARMVGAIDAEHGAKRYRHIREFERMLDDEGTSVVKVFLHISKDEQRARLQARIDDPAKNWKFQKADLEARRQWDDYQALYEEAITETSTGVGALVRGAGRPEVGARRGRRGAADPGARGARPPDPRPRTRARGDRRRVGGGGRGTGSDGFRGSALPACRLVCSAFHRPEWVPDGRRVA